MRRHILHVVGNFAVDDAAVGGLDEAERVDLRKRRKRGDEADVRALGRFNRADAPVVGAVYVADVESGAFTCQTARPKRRDAAFVAQFRERVDLILKLAELAPPEKLAQGRDDGAVVDELLRGVGVRVAEQHPLAHAPRHPAQPDADLVGDKFADGANAAVAEVIDVVFRVGFDPGLQVDEVLNGADQTVVDEAVGLVVKT